MMNKKTIALDFDGVLHSYAGWNNGALNGPLPGALGAVNELLKRGYEVKIFSTRDRVTIEGWLRQHLFPTLEVCSDKPICVVLVDDRAIRFDGEWTPALLDEIENFQTYWEKVMPIQVLR
jgi:hypothetical protein